MRHQVDEISSVAARGEARYALFYVPPANHPLMTAARQWLGSPAAAADRSWLTSEPRRYGFHATLKPPFRLHGCRTIKDLEDELSAFTALVRPIPIGSLRLGMIRGSFVLKPRSATPWIQAFASKVVERFDPYRAPFDHVELQRRLRDDLDDDGTINLIRWGYPFVFNRFDFHLTLTNQIQPEQQQVIRSELEARLGSLLSEELAIGAITLSVQPQPGASFEPVREFSLTGGAGQC